MHAFHAPVPAARHRSIPLVAVLCSMVFATGCASRTSADTLRNVAEGRYDQAQALTDAEYGGSFTPEGVPHPDIVEDDKLSLLWSMESGQIQKLAGDLGRARSALELASIKVEALRERVRTGAILRDVSTFIVNDTLSEYEGAGFEHIQVDLQRSLIELMRGQIAEGMWEPVGASLAAYAAQAEPQAVAQHYTNAVSYARRMTQKELAEVDYAAKEKLLSSQRYTDDPFARVYAAALMDAVPERAADDRQYADAMLKGAVGTYAEHLKLLGGQRILRYEVPRLPGVAQTLAVRNGLAYDPVGFTEWAARTGIDSSTAAARPAGQGSLLVLNEADFIARIEPLTVNAVVATVGLGTYEDSRGKRHQSRIGSLIFWATGPGSETVETWAAIPLPAALTEPLTTAGAPQLWRFQIPVHAPDAPNPASATVAVTPVDGGDTTIVTTEVIADLDAFARANLKDEQVYTAVKTLTRVAVKQLAVWLTAQSLKKDNELLAFLTQAVGSAAMSATEWADLRSAALLPNRVEAGLIDLPPGRYRVAVGGRDLGVVTIKPDRTTVLPARTFPAPIIVTD